MTIPSNVTRNNYTGTGTTGPYPVTFKFFEDADLKVTVADTDGAETVKTLTTDYTVTGAGEQAGGSITFTTAVTNGYSIVIEPKADLTQDTDIKNEGGNLRESIEDRFDRLCRDDQVQQNLIDRSVKMQTTDASVADPILPPREAGALIGWNDSGTGFANRAASLFASDAPITATGSTTARWVSDRFADVVNVKDFGAVGDGVTDDTAAIQDAIGNTFDGTAPAKTVFFPRGTYLTSTTVEVPPNCTLLGVGRYSTAVTGSLIQASHDGVVVRFVRRNASPGNLFHKGGALRMSFSTTAGGGASTKLIELGDSSTVTTSVGCWNVFIRDCTLRYCNSGYGIYSAHSQEAIIDGNFFQQVKYPIYYNTVVASCRITNNTLLDESEIAGAVGIFMRPGSLGGSVGLDICGNYIIGFDTGARLVSIGGAHIEGNAFEGCRKDAMLFTEYLLDEATQDGNGCYSCHVDGNTFINWAASAGAYYAIKLDYSKNNFIGRNCYQSPNGAAAGCVGYYDGGTANKTQDNVIVWPIVTGVNTSVLPLPTNSSITTQNRILGSRYDQEQSLSADPSTSGWGGGEQGRRWYNHAALQWKRWIDGVGTVVDYDVASGGPIFRSYSKASLPNAAAAAARFIYVTDEAGGATMAFSDGVNWRRVSDRAIVS